MPAKRAVTWSFSVPFNRGQLPTIYMTKRGAAYLPHRSARSRFGRSDDRDTAAVDGATTTARLFLPLTRQYLLSEGG